MESVKREKESFCDAARGNYGIERIKQAGCDIMAS